MLQCLQIVRNLPMILQKPYSVLTYSKLWGINKIVNNLLTILDYCF